MRQPLRDFIEPMNEALEEEKITPNNGERIITKRNVDQSYYFKQEKRTMNGVGLRRKNKNPERV